MAKVRVLVDYGAAEGYKPGDVVDMTNPFTLIQEGKVELLGEDAPAATPEPMAAESTVTPPADVVAEAPVVATEEVAPAVEGASDLGVDTTN